MIDFLVVLVLNIVSLGFIHSFVCFCFYLCFFFCIFSIFSSMILYESVKCLTMQNFSFVSFSSHRRKISCAEEKYGECDMALISTSQITSLLFRSTSQLKPRPWKRRTTRGSHKSLALDWRFCSHLIGRLAAQWFSLWEPVWQESSVTRVVLCDSHLTPLISRDFSFWQKLRKKVTLHSCWPTFDFATNFLSPWCLYYFAEVFL